MAGTGPVHIQAHLGRTLSESLAQLQGADSAALQNFGPMSQGKRRRVWGGGDTYILLLKGPGEEIQEKRLKHK